VNVSFGDSLSLKEALNEVGIIALFIIVLPFVLFVLIPLMLGFHVKYYRLKPPEERCLNCPFGGLCEPEEP